MYNKSKISWFAVILLVISTLYSAYAQTPDAFMFSSTAEAPAIVPQSPEAGSLGRYGSIPITSSTGQMSYSVPFYTIEVDGHSWPVGLNYNYGGLILEGKPSLMGLGWNLNGEAAVTRETRGLPDEHNYGYNSDQTSLIGTNTVKDWINAYTALENDENSLTKGFDAWDIATLRNFRDGIYDGEADKYTVSAGGIYFSFKVIAKFNEAGEVTHYEPYFLSKHANKVEILDSGSLRYFTVNSSNKYIVGFIITDTNGVKYKFDQMETSVPQGGIVQEMSFSPITAWKLSEITYLNGQQITFEYDSDVMIDYNYRFSGFGILTNVDGISENPNAYNPSPYAQEDQILTSAQYGDGVIEGIINRRLIKAIKFPKGQIDFGYTRINSDLPDLFTSIKLYTKKDLVNPINWFDFKHSGNRDLLDKIERNGEDYYEFEYHNENNLIPNFIQGIEDKSLGRQQDFWKFYNGAGNQFAINIPNSTVSGVNRDPSILYSKLGALKRIIYPTKGSTNIYYEQNQIKTEFNADSDYYRNLQSGKTKLVELDLLKEQVSEKSETFEILYPTVATISHSVSGDGSTGGMTLEIQKLVGESYYNVSHEGSTIPPFPGNNFYYDVAPWLKSQIDQREFPYAFPPMYPQLVQEFGYVGIGGDGNGEDAMISGDSSGKILIMPGLYKLRIHSTSSGADVRGAINIQFFGTFNELPPSMVNKNIGGIRVDYMKDCPDNFGENCFITNYDYNDAEGFSTGEQYAIPLLNTSYILDQVHVPGVNIEYNATYRKEYITYTESPFTVSNPRLGTPVFYKKIKTIKRKNGSVQESGITEIGYSETNYSLPFENTAYRYPQIPLGVDLDKSLPLISKSFEQGKEDPVSYIEKEYSSIIEEIDIDNDHPWSIKVYMNQYRYVDSEIYNFGEQVNWDIGSFQDVALKKLHGGLAYRELDNWDRLNFVEKTVDGITTKEEFEYNENQKVKSVTVKDSRGNESHNFTKYANDFSDLNAMANLNQISQPVQVENFYNGVLQSTQKTDFVLNVNGYKPSKVFAAKGDGDLEAKMQFTYDDEGKIIQVDQLLDSPDRAGEGNEKALKSTSYVWGYNNEYPVIKVDNATVEQLDSSSADLGKLKSNANTRLEKEEQLEILRNSLPTAFVSGYMYNPLIGISNMVDSRGYTTNYEYDHLNRLLNVKDEQDKMLQEYRYIFRSQNYSNPDVVEQYPVLNGSLGGDEIADLGVTLTYIANVTGGSGDFSYSWYKNDNFLTSGVDQFDITFDDYGTSAIRVDVTDNITGVILPLTLNVNVSINLGAVALNSNPTFGLVNTQQFTFNTSGVNTSVGNLSYEWSVDNGSPNAFTGATGFQTTFNNPGQHTVKLKVTDENTSSFIESEVAVDVFNPLNVTLSADKTLVLPNEIVTFSPSALNNNGSVSATWSIVSNSGTETLSNNGTSPYQYSFTSAGTYEVIYKLTGHQIAQEEQASVFITVTNGLSIGTIAASATNILVNDSVTFTKPSITGGSGNYSYEWIVQTTVESTINGDFIFDGFSNQNDYYIKLRVTDIDLNQTRESASVRIDAWNGLQTHSIVSSKNPIYTFPGFNFRATNSGNSGGSGSNTNSWYLTYEDNVETFEGNTDRLINNFSSAGTYTVRLKISDDLIANHHIETSDTFEVYNSFSVGDLVPNPNQIIKGTSISFTRPTVTGGSDNKTYQWLVDDVIVSTSSGNFTYNQFSTAKNYTVKFRVTDNMLNLTEERIEIVNVYDPLTIGNMTPAVSHIEVNETRYFNTLGISGGSGKKMYAWYVKFGSNDYTKIPSQTSSYITYDGFGSVGTYTIKFRVTDNDVANHFTEITRQVNVYEPIQIANSDITVQSLVEVNSEIGLNVNTASGGSGNFEYEWDIINQSTTPNNVLQVGLFSVSNRNRANVLIGYNLVGGSVKVQCRIHDKITGNQKTVYKIITVRDYQPISGLAVVETDTEPDPETASYKVTAINVTGGSGNYTYRWVIDGAVVQETSSNEYQYVNLSCSKPRETIICVAIDDANNTSIPVEKLLRLNFDCNGQ